MIPLIDEDSTVPGHGVLTAKPTGTLKAIGMAVPRAGLKAVGFLEMAGAGVAGLLGMEESQERFYKSYEEYIQPAIKAWTPDPASVSKAGDLLGSLAELPVMALLGAPTFVGTAMTDTAASLSEQGVDKDTIIEASVLSGISMAALTSIPAAGKTIKKTLQLSAVNPVTGMVQRTATKELLESKGYKDIAKAYDPLDPTAMAVDTAIGLIFGGMAHYGKARGKMPIEVEDAIDTAAAHQKNLKDSPFENTPKANRINLAAKDKAMSDISEGKPVDVSEQVKEFQTVPDEVPVPETKPSLAGKQPWQMTKEEAMQNAGVNRYGRTEIGGVEPDYVVGMLQRKEEFSPEAWIEEGHKQLIKKALAEGKQVPDEVLKDYPEIQALLRKLGPFKQSMPFKKSDTPEAIETKKAVTEAQIELQDTIDEVARLNGMEPEIMEMVQGSPEWLEFRKGKRMASESSAVLGISPFTSAEDLIAYKTGKKQFPETEPMRVGKRNEAYARDFVNQKYGTDFNPSVVKKGEFAASLDGISPEGKTILEVKVPYAGKQSKLWTLAQNNIIPEYYRAQLQHQLMISGADEAWFVVHDRKTGEHIRMIEKPDTAMQKRIIEGWDKFWPKIASDKTGKQEKVISPEKEADIINSKFEGKEPDFIPNLIISGGMPGSGKSSSLSNMGIRKENYVDLNADHLKEDHGLGHEKASELTKKALQKAVDENYNVIYDSLLTNAELVIPQIKKTLANGGRVDILYIYTDIETSAARAKARNLKGQTARTVPDEAVIKGYNRSLPTFIELFKRYRDNPSVDFILEDNNIDFREKVTIFKKIGEKFEIKDQKLFDELMSTEYNKVKGERYERTEKADTGRIEESRGKIEARYRSILESQPVSSGRRENNATDEAASSTKELTPQIQLKRPVKANTIVDWAEKQGKINYNKEKWQGELDTLVEKDPRFRSVINKSGKGLTLDELALLAKEEGFIKEADPQQLLDAIEKRKMRINDEEDFIVRQMEYNKPILNDPIEKMVESRLNEEGDLPAAFTGKDEQGRPVFESAREKIDAAKEDYHKTKPLEDVYTRIGNCLRNGG